MVTVTITAFDWSKPQTQGIHDIELCTWCTGLLKTDVLMKYYMYSENMTASFRTVLIDFYREEAALQRYSYIAML